MKPSSKKLFREFSLIRFYCILFISVAYFCAQLQTAYTTHSLILQIDAYHMLYNILSLIACILTIRFSRSTPTITQSPPQLDAKSLGDADEAKAANVLKNTFGWARIDVCGVVANLSVLLALCFSVVIDALQTVFHVSHHQTMNHPKTVAIVAIIGLIINLVCFLAIGGYTFHQTGFLSTNPELGDDVVISASIQAYVHKGFKSQRYQGLLETFRDVFGTVLVLMCAGILILVCQNDESVDYNCIRHANLANVTADADHVHIGGTSESLMYAAGYIDPAFCIATAIILMWLSYSYAKDACRILLLTIPDHINVKSLLTEIRRTFPEILDVHDFHVWQLTPARVIATAHIVLEQSEGYLAIRNNVTDYLHSKGISHITIQPEFLHVSTTEDSLNVRKRPCFLPCDTDDCREKKCCEGDPLTSLSPCDSHLQEISLGTCQSGSDSLELIAPSSKPSERYPAEAVAALRDDLRSDEETELHPMI